MALIPCPHCGEMISDRAKACVHCGAKLDDEPKKIICIECGAEIEKGQSICPKCGCPVDESPEDNNVDVDVNDKNASEEQAQKVEITGVNLKGKKPISKKKIALIIVVIIAVIVVIFGAQQAQKQSQLATAAEQSETYEENLDIISTSMLLGAIQAETNGNLIKSVWYNCIYEKEDDETDEFTRESGGRGDFYEDFNDALSNLFSDSGFIEDTEYVEQYQDTVTSLMKEMQDPPEEWEEAYDSLKEAYDVFYEFTNMVINPSGSYTTFSSNFSELDSEFATCYNNLILYLDD